MNRMPRSWEWLGEPYLALDFANTLKREGRDHVEMLRDADDLLDWRRHTEHPVRGFDRADAAERLDEVRAVRDAVFAVLRAAAEGAPLPSDAARELDERARRDPIVPQLGGHAVPAHPLPPVDELLARAAAEAITLANDPLAAGLAFCDAPSCGTVFIRLRAGQRWCGPACGTRARVARHAARHAH